MVEGAILGAHARSVKCRPGRNPIRALKSSRRPPDYDSPLIGQLPSVVRHDGPALVAQNLLDVLGRADEIHAPLQPSDTRH